MTDKMDQLLNGFYDFRKSIESRLDKLEDKVDKLDNKVDKLDNKVDKLTQRFDILEYQFKDFMKDFRTVRTLTGENMRDVGDLTERVEKLEVS